MSYRGRGLAGQKIQEELNVRHRAEVLRDLGTVENMTYVEVSSEKARCTGRNVILSGAEVRELMDPLTRARRVKTQGEYDE